MMDDRMIGSLRIDVAPIPNFASDCSAPKGRPEVGAQHHRRTNQLPNHLVILSDLSHPISKLKYTRHQLSIC
jgi:hypothetical protein